MRFYVCSIFVDRVFLTIHIPPWSSMDLQVLRICRSQRLDMGLKRVSWVQRYQGQCRALRPLGHQGYRLRNYMKDRPLCSSYMVAEEIMTLLLESPRTPLDHRTLAGLSLVLGHCVFLLRLHSWLLPSKPRINLQSVLTVAIDIGLEFILALIVV